MSNSETGFFRPVPISADSILAFKYTSEGFQPILIANKPELNVNAIDFLGQQIVEQHPIVEEWIAPPPSSINIDSIMTEPEAYSVFTDFGIVSCYPVIQGYKDYFSYGMRFNLSDPIGFQNTHLTASYSPYSQLPVNERFHLDFAYSYLNWKFESTYNRADFYDLFGPTKSSRKGYSFGLNYHKNIIYDMPRIMDYTIFTNYYGNLERLPDYQNVIVTYDNFFNAGFKFNYQDLRASLGSVDREKGYRLQINSNNNFVKKNNLPSYKY